MARARRAGRIYCGATARYGCLAIYGLLCAGVSFVRPRTSGSASLGFTRIDSKPINDHSKVYFCDYVVVLDESLLDVANAREGIKPDGILVINSNQDADFFTTTPGYRVYTIDASSIAQAVLKQPVVNTAMFGALIAVSDLVSLEAARRAVELTLPQEIWKKTSKSLKRHITN